MDSSPNSEIARLVQELDSCRQDLQAANERIQLSRKENDRLRASCNDIRTEHSRLLADETSRRVSAETQFTRSKAEVERERRLRRDAEQSASDAASEQRRHVEFVTDARKQFESRLTALVTQLRQREEQVHNLEYQVRDRDRERQRADALEKIVASREANLATLTAELAQIRREYTEVQSAAASQSVTVQTLQQQLEFLKNSNNNNNSQPSTPLRNSNNNEQSASPPAPPSPEEDPHVQETARLVAFSREWIRETLKEFGQLHSEGDHLVQLVEDTGMMLEKGGSHAGLDLANTDRRRLQKMRELETLHVTEQMSKLEGILPSTTIIRNGLSDVKFQVSRIGQTVQSAVDSVRIIRSIADKYCNQIGVPLIQQKLDRYIQPQPPPPLPTPSYNPKDNNNSNAVGGGKHTTSFNKHQHHQEEGIASNEGSQKHSRTGSSNSGESPAATNTTNPSTPVTQHPQQHQQQLIPQHQVHQQVQNTGPVVPLDEFVSLQQKYSQFEVSTSTDKVKLEGEIMTLKMQLQMEKDRIVSEKTKAEFEVERKFAEERRQLQREIDEAKVSVTRIQRQHEDELSRKDFEQMRAVEKARTELLEETRLIRDQCKSLEKNEIEAEELILKLQEQNTDSKNRRKDLNQECSRLGGELKREAEMSASLTMELHTSREAILELTEEVDRVKRQAAATTASSSSQQVAAGYNYNNTNANTNRGGDDFYGNNIHHGRVMSSAASSNINPHHHAAAANNFNMMNNNNNNNMMMMNNNDDTSGLGVGGDGDRNMWAEWKKSNNPTTSTSNNDTARTSSSSRNNTSTNRTHQRSSSSSGGAVLTPAMTSGALGRIAAVATNNPHNKTTFKRVASLDKK